MRYVATEEDRKHFCTYDQAYAAIIDESLPFQSNGHTHVATNLSTGHKIPCADAFMAFGYVAGSAILFPQWRFVIQMGEEKVGPFKAHPLFAKRMKNANWRRDEEQEKEWREDNIRRANEAQEAYNYVLAHGGWRDEY